MYQSIVRHLAALCDVVTGDDVFEGALVDSYVVIERESKGYESLQQVYSGQHISGDEEFFLYDGPAMHHSALFSDVRCHTDNGMDLLPCQAEWYTEQGFISTK